MTDLTSAELDFIYEQSKINHNPVVGSEVRQMIGMIRRSQVRTAMLEMTLQECERFMAYFANETDGHFSGPGTPATCLQQIRDVLASD